MPQTGTSGSRLRVGKIPFQSAGMDDAVDRLMLAAQSSEPISIRLSNAYCVALASTDTDYAALMDNGGLNYPDGAPIAWFMNRMDPTSDSRRVRGPSFFRQAIAESDRRSLASFFLGTTDTTLHLLRSELLRLHPELRIAGTYSPPFAPPDDAFIAECCARIEGSGAQILWVALGTPKQDFVADRLAQRLGIPAVAVGAAFDFAAGTVREAPSWIQRSGFEWLYRLCSEPKRLWRRYLIGNVRFIYSAVLESKRR